MPESRRITEQMLNQPVTAYLRKEIATLSPQWTVDEALREMRKNPPTGRVIYFYVTDADGRLTGVVPTRRLLLSAPDAKIEDVMIRGTVAIPDSATVLEACEFFTMHRFLAFPVVDADRRLVGLIDVELYTDELAELAEHETPPAGLRDEVFQLIGVHLSEQAQGQPLKAAAGRFPWLLCNIGGGLAAAFLSGMYEDVLERWVALALFIPIVLALSESVAIQSVTLALEGLRTRPATWGRMLRRGFAEGGVGLLLGAGCAAVVAMVAGVWLRDAALIGVLLGAIGLGVTGAALIGYAVPTLLHLTNRNPQVAAGPVALAAADLVTLTLYFNMARAIS
jgi:magnesium transporter